jgi:hypothetical protein
MTTVTTRAGKGTPLTWDEVDANFTALAGDTYDTKKTFATPSAAGVASYNMPHGVAPTTLANGDMWTTTAGLFARLNGATRQFADLTSTQTLSAKTLTTPIFNGVKTAIATKTAAYTALATDSTLLCDATTAAFTVTLPAAASNSGLTYIIKKIDASVNAVTVDANLAETIDGALTKVLSAQYAFVVIQSNGTNWFVIG